MGPFCKLPHGEWTFMLHLRGKTGPRSLLSAEKCSLYYIWIFFIKAMLRCIVTTSIKAAFTSNRCFFFLLNLTIWYNKKADQTRLNWTGLVREHLRVVQLWR